MARALVSNLVGLYLIISGIVFFPMSQPQGSLSLPSTTGRLNVYLSDDHDINKSVARSKRQPGISCHWGLKK